MACPFLGPIQSADLERGLRLAFLNCRDLTHLYKPCSPGCRGADLNGVNQGLRLQHSCRTLPRPPPEVQQPPTLAPFWQVIGAVFFQKAVN